MAVGFSPASSKYSMFSLRASGLSAARIVLGKVLALSAVFAVLIALAFAMPLSLELGTTLDLGRLSAAAFGLVLFAAALTALALCASSYAQQPVVAAIVALATNLVLWMLDAGARFEGVTSGFINYLALPTHLEPFLHGVISTVDIVYFVLLSAVALTLAARRLGTIRTQA